MTTRLSNLQITKICSKSKCVIDDDSSAQSPETLQDHSSEEENQEFYDPVENEETPNDHCIISGMASYESMNFPEDSSSDGTEEY